MAQQALNQVLHRRVAYRQLYLRVLSHKIGHRLGHNTAERERYADVQLAGKQLFQLLQAQHTVIHHVYALTGHRQQYLASLGKHHLMTVTHKQLLVKLLLQVQNLLRQRALGDKQLAGCLREIKRFGHT